MAQILLLESDRQLSKAAKQFLGLAGHNVKSFADPQNAIAAANASLPDAVVLDISLAGRSGIEFLYELRSYPDWQYIPVIVTGSLSPADLQIYAGAFEQLGVTVYVPNRTHSLGQLQAAIDKLPPPTRE